MIKKTYKQVQQEIAQLLMVNENLIMHCRNVVDVLHMAEGNTSDMGWNVFNASFAVSGESGSEDCNIVVDEQPGVGRSCEGDEHLDEMGDLYTRYMLEVKVNYPCYGGSSPREVQSRLVLCTAVNDFALQIEQKFCSPDVEVWALTDTKEAIAERAIKLATAKLEHAVLDIIVKNCSHMRVGAERKIEHNPGAIPMGVYTQALNDRTYELEVYEHPSVDGVAMVLHRM